MSIATMDAKEAGVTLNEEVFRAWIAALRANPKQGRSALGDETVGFCCLGVMMTVLPGVRVRAVPPDGDQAPQTQYCAPRLDDEAGGSSATGMFPYAYAQLFDGIPKGYVMDDGDLFVDFPYDQRTADHALSAMMMNDGMRLTFDQIADVFEYFGVVPPVLSPVIDSW